MIYLFENPEAYPDTLLEARLRQIPPWRRDKALQYIHPGDKKRSVLAFLLLRLALHEEYGITAVIHTDPVTVGNAFVDTLKAKINGILAELHPSLSMHDFRITDGENRVNLIFDLVVPFSISTEESVKMVEELKEIHNEATECALIHKTMGNDDLVKKFKAIMDYTYRYKDSSNFGLQLGSLTKLLSGGGYDDVQRLGTSGDYEMPSDRLSLLDGTGRG